MWGHFRPPAVSEDSLVLQSYAGTLPIFRKNNTDIRGPHRGSLRMAWTASIRYIIIYKIDLCKAPYTPLF